MVFKCDCEYHIKCDVCGNICDTEARNLLAAIESKKELAVATVELKDGYFDVCPVCMQKLLVSWGGHDMEGDTP